MSKSSDVTETALDKGENGYELISLNSLSDKYSHMMLENCSAYTFPVALFIYRGFRE